METVLRVLAVYFIVLVGLRVIGKRELSEMSPLELVTLLLIPELVTQALNRQDYSMTHAVIGVSTLLSIVFIMSVVRFLSRPVDFVIEGQPVLLVAHGELIADNLNRERVTPQEIFEQIHRSGLERLEQVRWAVLETDGKIAIIPTDQRQGSTIGGAEDDEKVVG